MATTITLDGVDIDYRDWSIDIPLSPVDVAPSADITTTAAVSINANDPVTITIDGTDVFAGYTRSNGTKSELGGQTVEVAHGARDLFEETVSFGLPTPTVSEVLNLAINSADNVDSYTLDYAGTPPTLNNDYNVTDRPVKRIFRDMMDRTGRVWWVDPAGTVIHVETPGGRGLWQSLDTQADRATLQRIDEGNLDTVRNAVTVVGTGEEQVRATVEDSTSITEYGRRPGNSPYNVSYVTTEAEAAEVADSLLIPDPLPEGKLLAGTNVGDVTAPLVNQTVDVTDEGKNVNADGLIIENQTIEQGRAELALGAGAGTSISELNRKSKSQDDQNEPGSVYNTDRIADDSIDTNQLVDASVIEQKIQDAAVATAKLQNNAVINGKLDDLSVSETKIQDDSISTPKLVAEAVTANEIEADTITAAQIAAGTITALEIATDTLTADEIAAGTITALEIASDTITANEINANTLTADEIDVLNLDANEISITDNGDGIEFAVSEVLSGVNSAIMLPTGDGISGIGLESSAFQWVYASSMDADAFRPISGDNSGSVGTSVNSFAEMHAYSYIDASTGSAINDGGDPTAGLAEGHGPPDHAAVTDDEGEPAGYDMTEALRSAWDVNREQERKIEALEDTVDDLEQRLSDLEQQV